MTINRSVAADEISTVSGFRAEALYDSLSNIPSEILLMESRQRLEEDTLPDVTVTALTIVNNRYYQHESDTTVRRQAIEASQMLGNIYMVRVIDYKKAYKSLSIARQMAEEAGDENMLAAIYNSLANLYSVNPGDPARKSQKIVDCLKLAAEAAIHSGNLELLRTITISMSVWSFPRKSWGEFDEIAHLIKEKYASNPDFKGPLLVLDACDSYFSGDTDMAEHLLIKAKKNMNFKKFSERYQYSLDLIISDLYAETGDYAKAVDIMKEDMAKAEHEGHTDFLLNLYQQLAHLYRCADIPDSTDHYYLKYIKLKNDFAQRSSFGKVEEFDFLSQIDAINAQVEQLSFKRRQEERRNIIVIAALIVTFILLLMLLVVYLNLKRNHRNLFQRNREMLAREEQYKLLREQWEEQHLDKCKKNDPAPSDKNSSPHESDLTIEKDLLSDEDMTSLKKTYGRILMIFEESRDIYNIGFSINDLARMAGQSARTISKAINMCHGDNFHQLLNKYRLREATRLMHEADNNCITIEAIAEKTGFKSRTSFATLFKKTMGITPSEYWRMAQREAAASTEYHHK